MKKKEIVILVIVALVAVLAIGAMKLFGKKSDDPVVAIYHGDTIVQEFDPHEDAVYTIEGDYGTLDVEVKDDKWHVTNEQCPNHICAQMGWVGIGEYMPITCLPNNIVIVEIGGNS